MTPRPVIHVLTGPTAVGKTGVALAWAEAAGAEIVSCDSLLVYRGMDIGTAKPTPAERARVPHHLIDVTEVGDGYDVQQFVAAARSAVDDIRLRGRRVLVVGGSGFYLRSFFAPMSDALEVDPALRAEIGQRLQQEGLVALVAELQRLNPGGLGALDVHNPRRVVRALERCRASGRTLAEIAAEFAARPGPFADCEVQLVRLDRTPADLNRRIERRVGEMLAAGLVEEVRRLDAAGLRRNPSASRAIGYRETLELLDGRLPAGELAGRVAQNTRALVKKQRTWFKTQLPAHPRVEAASADLDALFLPPV